MYAITGLVVALAVLKYITSHIHATVMLLELRHVCVIDILFALLYFSHVHLHLYDSGGASSGFNSDYRN